MSPARTLPLQGPPSPPPPSPAGARFARLPPLSRLALVPAGVVILLLVALLWAAYALVQQGVAERAQAHVDERASVLAERAARGVTLRLQALELGARDHDLLTLDDPVALRRALERVRRRIGDNLWLGLAGPDGRVFAATDDQGRGSTVTDWAAWLEGRQRLHAEEAVDGGVATLRVGLPLQGRGARAGTVLLARLDLQWLTTLAVHAEGGPAGTGARGFASVVSLRRALVLGQSGNPRSDEPGFAAAVQAPLPGRADFEWEARASLPRAVALAPVHRFMTVLASLGLALAGLLALGGYALARRITQAWTPLLALLPEGGAPAEPVRRGAYIDGLAARAAGLAHGDVPMPVEAATLSQIERAAETVQHLVHDAGLLKRVLDHLPVAVALCDAELRVQYINPAYTQLLGWTAGQAHGKREGEFLLPDGERQEWRLMIERLDQPPRPVAARLAVRTACGGRVPVQWQLEPLPGANGAPGGALVLLHDIRAERAARAGVQALAEQHRRAAADTTEWAQQLAACQHHLASALDAACVGVWRLDARSGRLTWSRGLVGVFGEATTACDRGGERFASLVHEADRVPLQRALALALAEGQPFAHEFRVRCSDGRQRWLAARGRVVEAVGGAELTGVTFDITARRRVEQELLEARDQLIALGRMLLRQERETLQQLAHGLQEEVGQAVAALRLAAERPDVALPPEFGPPLRALQGSVRRLLDDLRAPLLDRGGLAGALDNELRRQAAEVPTGADVSFQAEPGVDGLRWSAELEHAVFVVARECLHDALHRRGARRLRLALAGDAHALQLHLMDDAAPGPVTPAARQLALVVGARLVSSESAAGTGAGARHGNELLLLWCDEPAPSWPSSVLDDLGVPHALPVPPRLPPPASRDVMLA